MSEERKTVGHTCIGMCFCRRRHDNIGYAPTERHPVLWVCEECLPAARTVYHMPQKHFDEFERQALDHGGDKGGEFLDELGITDLAKLQEHEWREFLTKVMSGYSERMREFSEGRAPF